ncbi:MAG: ABC transporter ATP-binding protein [Chloroherpetonaceae bacterium]|nr:ABC transporter ATP-binding protein [Chloroherpetonaceae bacterium]MCS7211592.1 ABC transporter ATP-binding protein [Chloroherpetonaceae bacterium]MDW8019092.1 ABC transporter ATP-binding protein [Chloroherpetonaceae bacterium]MDW8464880.1 ABC transporter ATP-binding protein [Chloroherpetonaceae bacterium]
MTRPVLEAKAIFKTYLPKGREPIQILRGISLSVSENEIITIVGASGSGKTTLLNILGTLDLPDSGEVHFQGKCIVQGREALLSPDALAAFRNQHIGFVFQFHHLLEDFTALENVAMPKFIATGNLRQAKAEAEALLVSVGLQDRLHHLPSELSGGEQQRVAVARALINRPSLVLADEPSGNLDSYNSDKLYDLIAQLAREHRVSFVIVTHNPRYAALSDRCLQMKDGVLGVFSSAAVSE